MPFDFAIPRTALQIAVARDDHSLMRATECDFPREAFASMEEVRYAHQLRLRLRQYFLGRPVPPARPWSVGAD
jgi:hypothetical protein